MIILEILCWPFIFAYYLFDSFFVRQLARAFNKTNDDVFGARALKKENEQLMRKFRYQYNKDRNNKQKNNHHRGNGNKHYRQKQTRW